MIDTRLADRVALVTGADNPLGIGAAIARALAREGAVLALTAPAPACAAGELVRPSEVNYVREALRADEVRVESFDVDLAVPEAASELFDQVEESLGPVEILVNNAAHCDPDSFRSRAGSFNRVVDRIDATSLDAHHAVNTRAPALLMARFHERHLARAAEWGRIVNISTDGSPGAADEVSYWASKHALESLTRSAALELGALGITVNAVSPGPVQTGWLSRSMAEEFAALSPLGRVGRPDDIADVVVFLASHQGRWITGQNLLAGGGKRLL